MLIDILVAALYLAPVLVVLLATLCVAGLVFLAYHEIKTWPDVRPPAAVPHASVHPFADGFVH